jgi:hypothetical protein
MEAHEFHYSCPTTKDVSETDAVGARLNLTEIANRDPDDYIPHLRLLQTVTVSISTLDFTIRRIPKVTPVVSLGLLVEPLHSKTRRLAARTRSFPTWEPMGKAIFATSTERRCAPAKVPVSRQAETQTRDGQEIEFLVLICTSRCTSNGISLHRTVGRWLYPSRNFQWRRGRQKTRRLPDVLLRGSAYRIQVGHSEEKARSRAGCQA